MGCKGAACSSAEGRSKGTLLPISTYSIGSLLAGGTTPGEALAMRLSEAAGFGACMR